MSKTLIVIANFLFSIIIFLIGGFDNTIKVLLFIIGIDYITGVCKAIYSKKLNSKIGLKGILKKFGYLLVIALSTLVDYLINDGTMAIRSLVIYFFIANESISILENWNSLGLPLPKKLYDVFEKLKQDN